MFKYTFRPGLPTNILLEESSFFSLMAPSLIRPNVTPSRMFEFSCDYYVAGPFPHFTTLTTAHGPCATPFICRVPWTLVHDNAPTSTSLLDAI